MTTVATSAPDFGVPADGSEDSGRGTLTRVPVHNLTVGEPILTDRWSWYGQA
jgi:hypothetical protein